MVGRDRPAPNGSRILRRLAPLLIGLVGMVAGGCEYLYGPLDEDEFAPPKPLATYTTGAATLTIGDGPAITLDGLETGALLDDAWYGAEATWTNADGWYLRVTGASAGGGFLSLGGSITLDRVVDGEHWTTWDSSRCVVTVEAADEKALRGTATCKGLRWSDAIVGTWTSLEPEYVEGQDAFDAEITFEAKPTTTQQT